MGRIVRRVSVDFDWPIDEVWKGFLRPDKFEEKKCPDCKNGNSPRGQHLYDLWYGHVPFSPRDVGLPMLNADTPAVRKYAERNVRHAPDYYGAGEGAIRMEAARLARLFNSQWCHHLSQDDVDVLAAEDRLWSFTHEYNEKDGWTKKEPAVVPTAAQVNEWSIGGMGHDAINAYTVIGARCEREGVSPKCATCDGHGSLEAYLGQRAESDAWEPEDPPSGEGWQLWETVSEGSPVSPVFATAKELAKWMSHWKRGRHQTSFEVAMKFIDAGWAPSAVFSSETGLLTGVEAIGRDEGGK